MVISEFSSIPNDKTAILTRSDTQSLPHSLKQRVSPCYLNNKISSEMLFCKIRLMVPSIICRSEATFATHFSTTDMRLELLA